MIETGLPRIWPTYNGLGQLTSVTMPDGALIQYVLDGQGLHLGKKVNGVFTERYLYDELGRIVTSFDENNHPKNIYVYHTSSRTPDAFFRTLPTSPDPSSPDQLYHVVLDHLGSPKLVVNVFDNSIVEELSYDEFGNVTMDTNPGFQPFGFAGGLYDRDTKLVHFGAREYDASVGRWLSRDPIEFHGGDTNLYGYVLNDPVNEIDSTGTGPLLAATCRYLVRGESGASQSDLNAALQRGLALADQKIAAAQAQIQNSDSSCPTVASMLLRKLKLIDYKP